MPRLDRKIVLVFCALLIALTGCSNPISRSVETVNGTPVPAKKMLGAFYPIEGTHYQLASIATDKGESSNRGYDFSQLFSYGRSDYSVYNYVFLDVDGEKVHALLPTNENAILSIQGYPTPNANQEPKIVVAWWLYTIVKEDTNKDEQLSYPDKKTLAISDVGGDGYTEIIADVDQVLGDAFKAGDVLLIIYRAKGKNFLAHVDLAARKVTTTTELPSFGEDVK
jgi:hypothetical protein